MIQQSRLNQSNYQVNNLQQSIAAQSKIRALNQSQIHKSQMMSRQSQLLPIKQYVKSDPDKNKIPEEELDKKHPSTRVNHLACLVALLMIAYGIAVVCYSCGARYITLTVFGSVMFILCLVSFYRQYIHHHRQLFYGISAFFIFMTGVTSLVFISQIEEQIYCSSQWCHKQVETRDFFSDYLNKKYTSSQLSQQCSQLNKQYSSTMLYEQIGQFLVSEMVIYCQNNSGNCDGTSNVNQHIYWHNLSLMLGMIITLGILEIFYALWLVWWLKYRNPRDDIYEQNSIQNQKVQIVDGNGSMIINHQAILNQQGLQNNAQNQSLLETKVLKKLNEQQQQKSQALNQSIVLQSPVNNLSLIETRVQQKINEHQYNNVNSSLNQSIVNSTRNLNMAKPQDNPLMHVGKNSGQSNVKNSNIQSYQHQSSMPAYQQLEYAQEEPQIVKKIVQKPLANNPLKNIVQNNSYSKVESSSPKKYQKQSSITQNNYVSKVESSSPVRQQSIYQNNSINFNQNNSNLQRSITNVNGRTHQLSQLVVNNNGNSAGGVLSNGIGPQSIIRKGNIGNISDLKPYT
ncbi:hypothetical protein ABPG72_004760 [Tetrahymena utriculariae]